MPWLGPRQVLDLEPGSEVSHVQMGSSALHLVHPQLVLWIGTSWSGDVGASNGGGGTAGGAPIVGDGGALGLVGAKLEVRCGRNFSNLQAKTVTRWFVRIIMKGPVMVIILLILLHIFQLLWIDTAEVVVASDTRRLELSDSVEGCLQIIQHMLRSKDVAANVVRCRTNELALVGQPVGLDLHGLSRCIRIFFTKHHVCWSQPTNLVEGTLSGVSPEPNTFSKLENAALTLVLPAQGSPEFGVCICTCECQPC